MSECIRSCAPCGMPCYIGRSPQKPPREILIPYLRGGIRYSEKRREQIAHMMKMRNPHPTPVSARLRHQANRFINRLGIFTKY